MTITVFAGGCFDLLHYGHVEFLERCSQLGDRLVVGLNTDQSIRGLKGPTRPIVPYEQRRAMLLALRYVDAVFPIHEATPCNVIRWLAPQIVVKGPGYDPMTMPEVEAMPDGGRIIILPGFHDVSTTKTIESLQQRQYSNG